MRSTAPVLMHASGPIWRRSVGPLLAALLASCHAPPNPGPVPHEWFVDRAEEFGLDFVHVSGMSGRFYFPENMAPGVALVDYDRDGDMDVFLVQGRSWNERGDAPAGRLFRNDLTLRADGTRALRFTDVTRQSRIVSREYGMGVAVGDLDNDGCPDLYLTNFGPNRFLRNRCDGTFEDLSARSGAADPGFSVSASFLDYDRDGWLDLYVGNYLEYSLAANQVCTNVAGERDYCPPHIYPPQADRLYRNNGNGTFADVTARALVGGPFGPALGVSTADFDGDGWIDIYVANDNRENLLWMNRRNGTLENVAPLAGAALPASGRAEASMGADAGDFDGDGDEDLFVTVLTGEGHNLFVNDGSGVFADQSTASGLGPRTLPYTGFGTAWLDYDNDGRLDLLTVNGTIAAIPALRQARDKLPYHQPKQLFRNVGNGRFEDVSANAGASVRLSEMGRGAAFGDIDNDGDTDVVVANGAGRARLLVNEVGARANWVGLRLVTGTARRDALGARVVVTANDGTRRWGRARSDGSYASANDPRVLIGLGAARGPVHVRVLWPSGKVEEWTQVPSNQYSELDEGGSTR